jgi:hypothetical protein
MDPEIWGPRLWFFLHTISFNYPDNPSFDDMKRHQDFYENIVFIIPCKVCSQHYSEHLHKNPPKLSSKKELIKWTIDLHNSVNQTLDKKIYTYKEAVELISNSFKKETSPEKKSFFKWYFIGIIFIILIVAYYVYIRSYKKIKFKRN